MRPAIRRFDKRIVKSVLALPENWNESMLMVSTIGQPAVMLLIPLCIIGYGLIHHRAPLILAGGATIAVFMLNLIVKMIIDRARPNSEYVRKMIIQTASFPSAHATASVACLGLGTLLALHYSVTGAILLASGSAIACLLIGLSRVYLRAHYPSDIIGGWLLGSLGIILAASFLQP